MERDKALSWLEENIGCIPSAGVSKNYKSFLKVNARIVVNSYFAGKSMKEVQGNYGDKNKGFVRETYLRLENIRLIGARKVAPIVAKSPADLKENWALAEAVIRYSTGSKSNLSRELVRLLQKNGENKSIVEERLGRLLSLEQREKDRKEITKGLAKIGGSPQMYIFIWEHLMKE